MLTFLFKEIHNSKLTLKSKKGCGWADENQGPGMRDWWGPRGAIQGRLMGWIRVPGKEVKPTLCWLGEGGRVKGLKVREPVAQRRGERPTRAAGCPKTVGKVTELGKLWLKMRDILKVQSLNWYIWSTSLGVLSKFKKMGRAQVVISSNKFSYDPALVIPLMIEPANLTCQNVGKYKFTIDSGIYAQKQMQQIFT